MKIVSSIAFVVACVSLILGVYSRVTLRPLPIAPGGGIEANVLLSFTNTALLFAVAFILMEIRDAKK